MNIVYKKSSFLSLFLYLLMVMLFWSLSRSLMLVWKDHAIGSLNGWMDLVMSGAHFDLAALSLLLLAPASIQIFSQPSLYERKISYFIDIYLICLIFAIVFLELETPYYIDKNGLRPNVSLLFSFDYPVTVFGLFSKSQLPRFIYAGFLSFTSSYFCWKWLKKPKKLSQDMAKWQKLMVFFVLIAAVYLVVSTVPNRENPNRFESFYSPSGEPKQQLIDSLVSNSLYSIIRPNSKAHQPIAKNGTPVANNVNVFP